MKLKSKMSIKFCFTIAVAFVIASTDSKPVGSTDGSQSNILVTPQTGSQTLVSTTNSEPQRVIVRPGIEVSQGELSTWTNQWVTPAQYNAMAASPNQQVALGHWGTNVPVVPAYSTYPTFGFLSALYG